MIRLLTDFFDERIDGIEKIKKLKGYYLSVPEREDCRKKLIERGYEIDTKLKLAKREFKEGLYIDSLFPAVVLSSKISIERM